jgi:hypothetical protein
VSHASLTASSQLVDNTDWPWWTPGQPTSSPLARKGGGIRRRPIPRCDLQKMAGIRHTEVPLMR